MAIRSSKRRMSRLFSHIRVWIEEAEDGFVDEEENLEDGEVCLRAVKAFASDPECPLTKRFLCAGALIQRPYSPVCDAWTADGLLDNGGPNLQLVGALKVLDELFAHHLTVHDDDPVTALRTFCVQCGSGQDEYTCASHMAATTRGFQPLRRLVQVNSIYDEEDYEDLDGMVFAYKSGKRRYTEALIANDRFDDDDDDNDDEGIDESHHSLFSILQLLPDEATVKRCMIVKELD